LRDDSVTSKKFFKEITIVSGGRIEGNEYLFKIQKTAPKLIIDEFKILPDKYYNITTDKKLDKRLIAKEISEGVVVEGCMLVDNYSFRKEQI
jgi:hypothetical protein